MLCGADRGLEIYMKKENKIRYGMGFLILIVLLILLLFLNINGGSIRLSAREILAVLGRRSSDATAVSILWNIRLPRILAALLLGGALSVSGFLLQTFFSNPIAGPFVLGISSGAKLVVALVMIFLLGRGITISSLGMVGAAFVGCSMWYYDRIYLLCHY